MNNTPSITNSLEQSTKEIGEGMNKIPHLTFGKDFKDPIIKPKDEDPLVAKLKKWVLIIFTALVLGTATFLVIKELIGRLF